MSANQVTSSITFAESRKWWGRRWFHDPFVHFIAIGLVLLGLYDVVAAPRPRAPEFRIVLTPDDMRQIEVAWTAKWQRPPTPTELQGLVNEKVREEVLYREALSMGLEQDDSIVKRRLAQKLEFLTEDITAIRDPTPAELEAWFPSHAPQFASPGRVTFRHIYFSPDKRGAHAAEDARAALAQLSHTHEAGDVSGVGDRFSGRDYYADRTPDQLAGEFGSLFPRAFDGLEPGAWRGPIESGLGWHLVWIDAVTPAHTPTFAEADRAEVKSAWIDEQRAASKRTAFDAIRAKYEVVMPRAKAQ
jgi:peptidyl-prolyl cis-trans isomerase C